jgi:hypothetical protein
MVNWIVTVNRPSYLETQALLVPKDKITELITRILDDEGVWAEGDYITKYREFKYHETLFELFSKQFELAKVDEAREGAVIQVLDIAHAPEKKAKPKKAMIAIIAALASGFVLLLFVFARQALSNAGQDSESAKKMSQLKKSWLRALGRA